ncbi:hypothetical protein BC940DRAFT_224543, partial [Gongronella butleri]
ERRRQKRQQKIMSSAGDRLSRITGTAFPSRAESPTPSPSTSSGLGEHASAGTGRTMGASSRLEDDPSEELGAPPPMDPLNMFGSPGMMPGMQGMGMGPMAGGADGMNMGASNNQNVSSATDPSLKYWNLLHLVSMLILGLYAVYKEWTLVGVDRLASLLEHSSDYTLQGGQPLFWYFATIQVALQSARFASQQGTMASTSTLAAIATQLPPPLNNIVTVFMRYRLIWSCLVQDICVLLFILGCAQVC